MVNLFNRNKAVSLDEQLKLLAGCGIRLKQNATVDTLLSTYQRNRLESQPYLHLLCAMGDESLDCTYLSDDIWHLDTECIEGDGSYVKVSNRLQALAKGGLPLENVKDNVNLDDQVAWLSFTLEEKLFKWDVAVNDDWVDPSILSRFAQLLDERKNGRRFTYIDLQGQDCLIGCATPNERELLALRTGLKVDWLK